MSQLDARVDCKRCCSWDDGYFLPSEGANNVALALFTFPSLARYEEYREKSFKDPECQAAFSYARDSRCVISSERSFFRPAFE
ncbi:MAG: NIPSNAP family protein [Sedimenticolaceae bacterium]